MPPYPSTAYIPPSVRSEIPELTTPYLLHRTWILKCVMVSLLLLPYPQSSHSLHMATLAFLKGELNCVIYLLKTNLVWNHTGFLPYLGSKEMIVTCPKLPYRLQVLCTVICSGVSPVLLSTLCIILKP